MTKPSEFEKKVKTILLILAIVLPYVGTEFANAALEEGAPTWLMVVARVLSLLGAGLAIHFREEKAKGSDSKEDSGSSKL